MSYDGTFVLVPLKEELLQSEWGNNRPCSIEAIQLCIPFHRSCAESLMFSADSLI